MLEILAASLVPLVVGYIVDRWGYGRTIARGGDALAKALPDGDARTIAEQAVIAANQKEIEREIARAAKARREHEARMSAIESGSANFGDLHKPKR